MKTIKLTDIHPTDYNPRVMKGKDFYHLTKSIENYGLIEPILINLQNMHIIAGHQRYNVLKSKNITRLNLIEYGDIGLCFLEEKPVIASEEDEKALNIGLNKINGEFDEESLQNLLDELYLSDIDIDVTGFDEITIEKQVDDNLYDFDIPLIGYQGVNYSTDDDDYVITSNVTIRRKPGVDLEINGISFKALESEGTGTVTMKITSDRIHFSEHHRKIEAPLLLDFQKTYENQSDLFTSKLTREDVVNEDSIPL